MPATLTITPWSDPLLDTTEAGTSPGLWKAPDAATAADAHPCAVRARRAGTHSGDVLCARSVRVVGAQIGICEGAGWCQGCSGARGQRRWWVR
jgi:hypothetical protein